GLRVAGVPRKDRQQRVLEHLEMVQLEKFAHARIHELSGGMRQRVALARDLVLRPSVLLMDEPFAALDVQIREEMQSVVQDLWLRSKTTTLFVTHDVREAAVLGGRFVVLWELIVRLQIWPRYLFPSPVDVASSLYDLWTQAVLLRAIGATLARLGVGFLISLVLGAILAFLMVHFQTFGKGIQPYVLG